MYIMPCSSVFTDRPQLLGMSLSCCCVELDCWLDADVLFLGRTSVLSTSCPQARVRQHLDATVWRMTVTMTQQWAQVVPASHLHPHLHLHPYCHLCTVPYPLRQQCLLLPLLPLHSHVDLVTATDVSWRHRVWRPSTARMYCLQHATAADGTLRWVLYSWHV